MALHIPEFTGWSGTTSENIDLQYFRRFGSLRAFVLQFGISWGFTIVDQSGEILTGRTDLGMSLEDAIEQADEVLKHLGE